MVAQIAPVFLFVLFGYLFKLLKRDISKELTDFVIFFSLPALALSKIRVLEFDDKIYKVIAISYIAMFLGFIFSFIIGKLLKLSKKDLAVFMMVSIFGNTSFIGFSYIESLYGEGNIVYALVYDQLGSFLALLTVGIGIITWGGGKGAGKMEIVKNIFFSPPLLAIFSAFALRGAEFPQFFENILDKLQATLIPLVTIIVGMKLELKGLRLCFKQSIIAIFIKMFLTPFVMIFIFYFFTDFSQTWAKVTFLEVAMPPMTMAVVYSIRGGLNKNLAVNSLALGIVVSFFSITAWNILIN